MVQVGMLYNEADMSCKCNLDSSYTRLALWASLEEVELYTITVR